MRLAVILAMLVLAGCAAVPRVPPVPVDWAAREAQLAGLAAWRMTGRVAVSLDGRGASASIDWKQDGSHSDVAVTGPLGVGALRAEFGEGRLTLEDGSGARLQGQAAEDLLADRLGTRVPLGSMRYWLLGVPAPGVPVEPAAAGGHFVQAGWTVDVGRLEAAGSLQLPTRLTLERDGARVKLAVNRWELPP